MYDADVFDTAVFNRLTAQRSATATIHLPDNPGPDQDGDIDALIQQSMLSFNGLMAADKTARVHAFERGYRVELGSQRLAFDMGSFRKMMEDDNEGVDLSFSDELATYQPEEGLVKKSKVPLWVLRPVGQKTVVIQRIW